MPTVLSLLPINQTLTFPLKNKRILEPDSTNLYPLAQVPTNTSPATTVVPATTLVPFLVRVTCAVDNAVISAAMKVYLTGATTVLLAILNEYVGGAHGLEPLGSEPLKSAAVSPLESVPLTRVPSLPRKLTLTTPLVVVNFLPELQVNFYVLLYPAP